MEGGAMSYGRNCPYCGEELSGVWPCTCRQRDPWGKMECYTPGIDPKEKNEIEAAQTGEEE